MTRLLQKTKGNMLVICDYLWNILKPYIQNITGEVHISILHITWEQETFRFPSDYFILSMK